MVNTKFYQILMEVIISHRYYSKVKRGCVKFESLDKMDRINFMSNILGYRILITEKFFCIYRIFLSKYLLYLLECKTSFFSLRC